MNPGDLTKLKSTVLVAVVDPHGVFFVKETPWFTNQHIGHGFFNIETGVFTPPTPVSALDHFLVLDALRMLSVQTQQIFSINPEDVDCFEVVEVCK